MTAASARERAQACNDYRTADSVRVEVRQSRQRRCGSRVLFAWCRRLRRARTKSSWTAPRRPARRTISAYRAIADALGGRGSFFAPSTSAPTSRCYSLPPEGNPQPGLRGLRTASLWPDLLRVQLKAAARVGCKIMLPMITAVSELTAVRDMLAGICRTANLPLPALGAMIETPSSAMLADQLAAGADFLSIGTNDLTQYVLDIDRGHRQLSAQLDALHPPSCASSPAPLGSERSRKTAAVRRLAAIWLPRRC
jgi:hypothetical protein